MLSVIRMRAPSNRLSIPKVMSVMSAYRSRSGCTSTDAVTEALFESKAYAPAWRQPCSVNWVTKRSAARHHRIRRNRAEARRVDGGRLPLSPHPEQHGDGNDQREGDHIWFEHHKYQDHASDGDPEQGRKRAHPGGQNVNCDEREDEKGSAGLTLGRQLRPHVDADDQPHRADRSP